MQLDITVPSPPLSRFTLRYGYLVCRDCGLTKEYCGCARQAAEEHTAKDGEDSELRRRIAEVVSKRGCR